MDYQTPIQLRIHARHADARAQDIARLYQAADCDIDHDPLTPHPARKLARRLAGCAHAPQLVQCSATGRLIQSLGRCNCRLCRLCAPIRAQGLAARVAEAVKRCNAPRLITLTLKASAAPLAEQIARLRDHFRQVRRRDGWRQHVTGGVACLEITYRASSDTWHPHLHILADGTYWPQRDLSKLWEAVTGDSPIVDIRAVHDRDRAARYVSKYVTKAHKLDDAPDRRWTEWAQALAGLRLAQTFGTLHGTRLLPERQLAPEGTEYVAHLGPIYNAAQRGDLRASRVWRALGLVLQRDVPDADGRLAPRAQTRHSRVAKRVRIVSSNLTEHDSGRSPPRPPTTAGRHHPDHRTLRLWEESDDATAAAAIRA